MKKVITIFLITFIIVNIFLNSNVFAAKKTSELLGDQMQGVSNMGSNANSNIVKTINNVIGLIQIAGTGISLIVVTMMGIKYMLAAPSEKADTKKMIMPIIIGCVLLFGAVNLVANMAQLSDVLKTE